MMDHIWVNYIIRTATNIKDDTRLFHDPVLVLARPVGAGNRLPRRSWPSNFESRILTCTCDYSRGAF